jgi:hypothetical protein
MYGWPDMNIPAVATSEAPDIVGRRRHAVEHRRDAAPGDGRPPTAVVRNTPMNAATSVKRTNRMRS